MRRRRVTASVGRGAPCLGPRFALGIGAARRLHVALRSRGGCAVEGATRTIGADADRAANAVSHGTSGRAVVDHTVADVGRQRL